MGRKKKKIIPQRSRLKRIYRMTFALNEEEIKVMNRFIKKYKVRNKSGWIRETMVTHVLKTLEEDYPTLFEEHEMK